MIRVWVFLLLSGLCLTSAAEPPDGYPFLPFDEAMQQAQEKSMPLFVYFGRYGCGYCDKTNAEAFSDSKVHQQFTANYVLAYVDSESGKRLRLPSGERITERELGTRYNAFVTPVFSFITTDGKVLARLVGVQRIVDLLEADSEVQLSLKGQGAL
jgi:thioredoxin-related protein